jgi:hypothetical protein
LAFDLAKTVVESACRTILKDRKIAFDSDDDLPRLFKTATTSLPMLPVLASSAAEARKSLAQTLNGLHTALQGVCELRNAYGFAAHGADGPRPGMGRVQALLAAQAADAIVGFLHSIHRQERSALPTARLEYDDHESFNIYVDESNEQVRIFELAYRPSEALFAVDREAYRDLLSAFEPGEAEPSDEVPSEAAGSSP